MKYKKYTEEEKTYITSNYLTIPVKTMARNLGRSGFGVRNFMKNNGLILPVEIIEKRKAQSQYVKGQSPINKGKKQSEFMSAEAIKRTKKTRFKNGNLPNNTLHDGAITIRKDKNGYLYKWIRISKANWRMLHVYNWEKINGPVPEGHILVFKNDDRMNCDPDNVRLITNAEHIAETRNKDGFIAKTMAATGRGKYDKELKNKLLQNPKLIELKRTQQPVV